MNLKLIVALVLLGGAVTVGVTSFRKTVTPYITFAEARRASGLVQVNGVLADKAYVLKPDEQYLSFRLSDDKGEVLPVEYRGTVPGNFDQATSIVAIGRYDGKVFKADQLLVKCPSKYQAEADKAMAKGGTS
ncbi:MAG: cytochrome c maturation protein CcmE [Candidatus Eisenbacteria bacterium]|uniref:Cytochrome c maturation protein CcmE n=1 Tax=Eiseniibacteriota bacterium TaxID=2212470 RepID=A0A849SYG2_UNCEI|nr:cytochrome c maturation protein CcmE [Candidatus Eisenbacteria bacterium]